MMTQDSAKPLSAQELDTLRDIHENWFCLHDTPVTRTDLGRLLAAIEAKDGEIECLKVSENAWLQHTCPESQAERIDAVRHLANRYEDSQGAALKSLVVADELRAAIGDVPPAPTPESTQEDKTQ